MFWIMIAVIVAVTSLAEVTKTFIKSKEKRAKIEIDLLKEQVKLEELRYTNLQLETEKMRLELKQDLLQSPTTDDLIQAGLQEQISLAKR